MTPQEWRSRFEISLLNVVATAVAQCSSPRIARFEAEARGIEAAEARMAETKRAIADVNEGVPEAKGRFTSRGFIVTDLVMTAEQLTWLKR